LRAATDGCQVGFNKAFMRVLVDRLTQATSGSPGEADPFLSHREGQ